MRRSADVGSPPPAAIGLCGRRQRKHPDAQHLRRFSNQHRTIAGSSSPKVFPPDRQVHIGGGFPDADGDGRLRGGHGSPLASAAFFSAASRSRLLVSRKTASSNGTVPLDSRFSLHCPSSIAACFIVALICDTRAASNFQISCLAFFPR